MSVVTENVKKSSIAVDDMLQLRKNLFFLGGGGGGDMILPVCSIWACHPNLLSTMRPSRRCSVIFSIF